MLMIRAMAEIIPAIRHPLLFENTKLRQVLIADNAKAGTVNTTAYITKKATPKPLATIRALQLKKRAKPAATRATIESIIVIIGITFFIFLV